MAMIDHWHPAVKSRSLKRGPVGVRLAGRSLVLFRDGDGRVGCLDDVCPHRRMRLSLGRVVGGRLQCRYHGWTYDADGQGESPGTPKLHACATSFDTREAFGMVWVKPRDAAAEFPRCDVEGFYQTSLLEHHAPAPLELVVDNFCEIEHTPTTHALFGYDLARMPEVSVRFEPTDTSVRVINVGPPKSLGRLLSLMLGIKKHYVFNDDWTTYFSPVYSVYEHWWSDPATGREAMVRWRLFIFFVPIDERQTRVVTFAFVKSRYPGPYGAVRPFKWLMTRKLSHEIDLDVSILKGLADLDTGIEGMKLSRFDRVLGLNRERIARIYRGEPA